MCVCFLLFQFALNVCVREEEKSECMCECDCDCQCADVRALSGREKNVKRITEIKVRGRS